MSMLRNSKYIKVLVTARCNKLDPFRSLQYYLPTSNIEKDNIRVESDPCYRKRARYFQDKYSYTYTRDVDGNLQEFVRH